MKKLSQYIASLVLIIILILYSLDYLFTNTYYHGTIRSKTSWVKSTIFPNSLDYVLLGSSRCIHHLQPEIISQTTHKHGLNLGSAASGPVEIKLMLMQVIQNTSVKKVFIQIDNNFNQTQPNNLAIVGWLPFIKEKEIYSELVKYDTKYSLYKNIPFYRYQIFDPKIGTRNVSLMLSGKESVFIHEGGYVPLKNVLQKEPLYDKPIHDIENKIFKEIIQICHSNKIEVYFFTSPIYNSKTDFSILNKYLPNYKDFSNSMIDRNLYSDGTHLNHQGATNFTKLFAKTYFNNE